MKEIHEILRDKERELARVRHEVDSLLFAIPLLSDDGTDNLPKKPPASTERLSNEEPELKATGTAPLFSSIVDNSQPSFWKALK